MTNLRKITLLSILIVFSTTVFSTEEMLSDGFAIEQTQDDTNSSTLSITINSSSVVTLKNIPQTGRLEIMSILGKRVTSKDLKDCKDGVYIDLPNGIYVIKVGKISQKIAIRN